MPQIKDKSIGIIVYHRFPRSLKFLILKHRKGHWSFAKGHKDRGETAIETAKRELREETGIKKTEFLSKKVLLKERYIYKNKNKKSVIKSVDYFIAKTNSDIVAIDKNEITGYRWCTLNTGVKLITFNQSRKLLRKAYRLVLKNKNK